MGIDDGVGTPDVMKEIEKILKGGWVSIGQYVEELESHFKRFCKVKHAIGCSSATTGLIIAIKAAGWEHKRIHIPAFTWPSTLYAVNCSSNAPIFHDINKDTWLVDYEQEVVYDVDCFIPVDTFGNQYPEYVDLPKEKLIYDAAHGYGLDRLGHRGIAEVVSLSFTKVVTGMEGGMILTNDDYLAETATELRRLSGRMGEINALIASHSISNYNPLSTQLAIRHFMKHITVPHRCQKIDSDTNNSVFCLLFNNSVVRDTIRIALEKAGCETKVYYDPLQRGYPNTENVYNRILAIPTHTKAIEEQDRIIEIINTAGRTAGTPGKEYLTK